MFDLFGNEIEQEEIKKAKSPYQKFKIVHNYRQSTDYKKCKNCHYKETYKYHNKYYHKCKSMGISMSKATDIRLKNVCDLHVFN